MSNIAKQIVAMSPNTGNTNKGQQMASTDKHWQLLAQSSQAIWAECKGTSVYYVRISKDVVRFKCSCKSRYKPCKHVLGTLFLYQKHPQRFAFNNTPVWVRNWINTLPKQTHQTFNEKALASQLLAKQKKAQERVQLRTQGIWQLEQWLLHLIEGGLAQTHVQTHEFWEAQASRMVDSKARGLAQRLQQMGGIAVAAQQNWEQKLLEAIASLYLLICSYKKLPQLPPLLQADIKACIDFSWRVGITANTPVVKNTWRVLGHYVSKASDGVISAYTYLQHPKHPIALLLQFWHENQAAPLLFRVNQCFEHALQWYPSNSPLRVALVKPLPVKNNITLNNTSPTGLLSINNMLNNYAQALAANPWLTNYPVLLSNCLPMYQSGIAYIQDENLQTLPVTFKGDIWELLAFSCLQKITVFGLWNGKQLNILSVWRDTTCMVVTQ